MINSDLATDEEQAKRIVKTIVPTNLLMMGSFLAEL
jgi:hypothetical protein